MPRTSLNAATPGMTRLAMAIGGGGQGAFDRARDNEVQLQSKLAQTLSAMHAQDASAALNSAKADGERADLAARAPEALRRNAMLANGIPLDEEQAVDGYFRTGQLGGRYAPAPDGMGPVDAQPAWADKLGQVARAIGGVQRAIAIGDRSSENIAKAGAIEREGRLSDAIINGTLDRNRVGGAQAAAGGKALFHQDASGGVLDQYAGTLDTNNGLAQSTIGLRGAQADNQRAGAVAHYASADSSRATAAKTRAEMEQGVKTGALQVVTGDDGSINIVNKVTGRAMPATGSDGKPLMGKGKDLNEGQANALNFAQRMQAAHDILGQAAAAGVQRPGTIKTVAEGMGHAVPIVGEQLGDAMGAATNFTQSARQQQVEQAQRDFINAVLRRESGAAIGVGEFKNAAKQYFPQVGDSPGVIAQKAAARERVIRGMLEAVPMNRRPGMAPAPAAQPAQPSNTGGATGDWGGPAQRTVSVDY